jgi:hypothetical protein
MYVVVARLIHSRGTLTEVVSTPQPTEKSLTQPVDTLPIVDSNWKAAFNETQFCCFSLLSQERDSNAAMAVTFLDPHISGETKRQLAQLSEASPPVEHQDSKTKLMWLHRPGKSPTLEGPSVIDTKAKNKKPQAVTVKAADPWAGLSAAINTTPTLIARAQDMEKRKLTSADAFTAADPTPIGTAARICGSGDIPGRTFWRLVPLKVNRARGKLRRCWCKRATRERPWTATIWLLRAAPPRSVLTALSAESVDACAQL